MACSEFLATAYNICLVLNAEILYDHRLYMRVCDATKTIQEFFYNWSLIWNGNAGEFTGSFVNHARKLLGFTTALKTHLFVTVEHFRGSVRKEGYSKASYIYTKNR